MINHDYNYDNHEYKCPLNSWVIWIKIKERIETYQSSFHWLSVVPVITQSPKSGDSVWIASKVFSSKAFSPDTMHWPARAFLARRRRARGARRRWSLKTILGPLWQLGKFQSVPSEKILDEPEQITRCRPAQIVSICTQIVNYTRHWMFFSTLMMSLAWACLSNCERAGSYQNIFELSHHLTYICPSLDSSEEMRKITLLSPT